MIDRPRVASDPSRRAWRLPVVLAVVVLVGAALFLRFWRLAWGLDSGRFFADEQIYWKTYFFAFRPPTWKSLLGHNLFYPPLYGYLGGALYALRSRRALRGRTDGGGAVRSDPDPLRSERPGARNLRHLDAAALLPARRARRGDRSARCRSPSATAPPGEMHARGYDVAGRPKNARSSAVTASGRSSCRKWPVPGTNTRCASGK